MTRMQQFNFEVNQIVKNTIRSTMPEVKMIEASFCSDLENDFFASAWSDFKIASGQIPVKNWITENGFAICKKSEATCLLRVGNRCPDSNCWIIGQYKNYWLKTA